VTSDIWQVQDAIYLNCLQGKNSLIKEQLKGLIEIGFRTNEIISRVMMPIADVSK
jgi:hypothetical protein